jgi:PAS domain S-box-containing protein
MVELTFCVPYLSLLDLARQVFAEHPEAHRIKRNILHVEVQDIPSLKLSGDAIIARGVAAGTIRKLNSSAPLIELPVTGYDILNAVHECKKKFDAKRIACLGSQYVLYGTPAIARATETELWSYQIASEEDGARFVGEAIEKGADAIVGGLMVAKLASSSGLPAVMIESGYESIRQAVDEAVRTALISRSERARVERLRTIMDYSDEGIVAVDEEGRVALLNRVAKEIARCKSEDAVGRNVDDLMPELELSGVLRTGTEELETLRSIGNTMVTASCVPLRIDSETFGAVAIFQKISRIQEVEGRIRRKLFRKGLTAKYHFRDIVGKSPALLEVIDLAKQYSAVDSNILLEGETGTGKELFAQSIHNASTRKRGPFVAVNCAAIPEHLIESELFGYVEGAFTGAAKAGKAGLFELAHSGTVFLDEISELPLQFQARLLRVLQEKEIMRLGHDRVIPIDVRVIAASNVSLKELVRANRFRSDLLYRIDVLRIAIPPLRKRYEDVSTLVKHYLRQNRPALPKDKPVITEKALALLTEHAWLGNVRELMNFCERVSIISKDGRVDEQSVLMVLDFDAPALGAGQSQDDGFPTDVDKDSFRRLEKRIIAAALRQCGGNKKKTAQLLGIDASTLWRKIKKYGIEYERVRSLG